VRWCLSIDPAARPSAAELSAALARFRTDPSGVAALAATGVMATGMAGVPGAPPTQSAYVAPGALPAYETERTGSGPWTWLAAGLGLVVIVASGILLFLLFSGVGDEQPAASPTPAPTIERVETPDLVGMGETAARAQADRLGLVLEVAYRETATVPAGRVIEQLPEPETVVDAGTTVQVTVATQVETVVVPDVQGIKEGNAVKVLEGSGLHAGERLTTYHPLLPAGYVVATDPRAGSSATRGTPIDYTVSLGRGQEPTSVPRATPLPTDAPTTLPSPEQTMEPTPFPSSEAALVYDYRCLPLATARSQIEDAGLLVGAVIPEDPEDDWVVLDQLPKPGSSIKVGSKVDLMLGDQNEPCPG
jgi:beta-lactam-binding protein with PASTA domain